MNRAALFALATVVALGAAGAIGYRVGRDLLRGELDAQKVAELARAADAAIQLAAAEQKYKELSQQLEDQANADPVQVPVALPHSRVLRLNERIKAANSAGP